MRAFRRHNLERSAPPSGNLLLDCCTKLAVLALLDREHVNAICLRHRVGQITKTACRNDHLACDRAIEHMDYLHTLVAATVLQAECSKLRSICWQSPNMLKASSQMHDSELNPYSI